jgi:hypothetical protein
MDIEIRLKPEMVDQAWYELEQANAAAAGAGFPDREMNLQQYIEWLVNYTLDQQRIKRLLAHQDYTEAHGC